jgi:Gram-negative bacterial TonB protein C-terminal
MSLKVRVRMSNTDKNPRPTAIGGYQFRPLSFFASVGVHVLVILALALLPAYHEEPASARPIYDELIRPHERRIVYYAIKKTVPDVTAAQRVGTFSKPRGREFSRDAIVATAPKAQSNQQIIWRPVPKVEIKRDVAAPNMIMRAAAAIPVPIPPPPSPPMPPKPNIEAPRTEQANLTPQDPDGDPNKSRDETVKPLELPKPRKNFVPPTPSKREPRLPVPVQVAELPVPDASIAGSSSARMLLPDGLGTAGLSKGAPPPPNAPPGPETTEGNGKTDIAVASLHPGDGPVPNGARSGAFSKAPDVGEPATGEVSGSGIKVPNLTIREDRSKIAEPPKVSTPRRVVLYADKMRSIPVTTLSVPLRPASRSIPRSIESRFGGRNVYTMVVPIENFEPYSGDWIVWFAEKEAKPGDTPFVRAPVPLRKYESIEPLLPGARTELRVQVMAVLRQDGKLDGVALLRNFGPGIDRAVIQDLSDWEFKPATRDNVPVDIDIVIEVPYSLPPQIAKNAP